MVVGWPLDLVKALLRSGHVGWGALSCKLPEAGSEVHGVVLPVAMHRTHSVCAIECIVGARRFYSSKLWIYREETACAVAILLLQ